MINSPNDPGTDADADADAHQALIGLHDLAGGFGPVNSADLPGFNFTPSDAAMRVVAEAPKEEIPASARLAVLHDLARAGFPDYETHEAEYRLLAASAVDEHGIDVDQLLDDLKQSAGAGVPFSSTQSGQQLPHHTAAFIGEDVCTVRKVDVGGLTATWIFSEFETDAPFDNVTQWVDPRNWPRFGPMLFKQMNVVGGNEPVAIKTLGDEHWHGVFHEEVQLVSRVNTLLHCDFWREGDLAAGMTYELNLSLDNELDVDRGFLSVNDAGPVRRVKALKIVGFTQEIWDEVAHMVCPFWTDWVRAAVQGGGTSTPKPNTHTPPGEPGSDTSPLGDTLDAWVEFFGDSARTYLELFGDVASRATSGEYSAKKWVDDGTRYWSQLAKDWAQAWSFGTELLDEVAREGLDAGFMPPGKPREAGRGAATAMTGPAAPAASEGTLIPVPGLGKDDLPTCTNLVSIEAGGATIQSSDITLSVDELDDGTYGVRLTTTEGSVAPGLYVGYIENPQGQSLAPAQLYLSRATDLQRQ